MWEPSAIPEALRQRGDRRRLAVNGFAPETGIAAAFATLATTFPSAQSLLLQKHPLVFASISDITDGATHDIAWAPPAGRWEGTTDHAD